MNTSDRIQKRIAIVADNNKKTDLIQWSYHQRHILQQHHIIATGPAADLLQGTLNMTVTKLPCISLGGYQDLAQMIEDQTVDIIFFFGDMKEEHAYNTGMAELLPSAAENEIVVACNQATADVIIGALKRDDRQSFQEKRYYLEPKEKNGLLHLVSAMG